MNTPPITPSDPTPAAPNSPFGTAQIHERLKAAIASITLAAGMAAKLDEFGDPAAHPEGSEEQALARTRDEIDRALTQLVVLAMTTGRWRATKSRSLDLLCYMATLTRGHATEALRNIDRVQELLGEEDDAADGKADSFPASFARDTYQRVIALTKLAESYPRHLRYCARKMRGWPMIVSPDQDHLPEYQRLAAQLKIGTAKNPKC